MAFLAGAILANSPGGDLGRGLTQARYHIDSYTRRWRTPPGAWGEAIFPPGEKLVVLHDRARAWQGANLFCTGEGTAATLSDMDGNVLHRWDIPLERAIEIAPAIPGPASPDTKNFPLIWRAARLLPGGDLLCVSISCSSSLWPRVRR